MDWHSRYVVGWRLSNTLEADFCVDALQEALGQGWPEVFNTGQGSQFTSQGFTQALQERGVKISMGGTGTARRHTIFLERLWRTVKYEEVYLKACADARGAPDGTGRLLPVLQRPEAPSGHGLPDSGEVFQEAMPGSHARKPCRKP